MGREDVERLREVRLRALATDPDAFASTLARERGRPPAFWDGWAGASEAGVQQRTFALEAAGGSAGLQDGDGDGAWVGLAMATRGDAADVAELQAMWVAPAARGRGGARALCDACAGWARERGPGRLELGVFTDNAAAVAVYAAWGFAAVRSEIVEVAGGRTLELLWMARAL